MNQHTFRSKAHEPRKNVPVKDFEIAIIQWDNDARMFEKAFAPEVRSEQNMRMFVEIMCPNRLRDHFAAREPRISMWNSI